MKAPMTQAAMAEHFRMFGLRVRDKVTGYKGVVTSIGFDLYGCIQAIVTPAVDDKNDQKDSRWFDLQRLEIESKAPVMDWPSFEVKVEQPPQFAHGPQEKPTR